MRLFICDPVCAQPFGHNAIALAYFSKAFSSRFSTIVPVCCKHLPERLVKQFGFVPFYEFYYHDYMRLAGVDPAMPSLPTRYRGYADELEGLATWDAVRLLDEHGIGGKDCIAFPSLDFYGVIGLLNALLVRPAEARPRLLLRFIGVMENASHTYRDPMAELAGRLLEAIEARVNMRFSAETPRLADHLSEMLEVDVVTTPYPDLHQPLPLPVLGPFVVYCPGSARFDKGFLHLRETFSEVRRRDPGMKIRFVAQSLSPRDGVHHQNYISQLYAIPGVELLESAISDADMKENYRRSSLIVLPYDAGIYKNRGSAAMMEAACFARPIISLAGAAFCEQIEWYRLGKVVPDLPAMIDSIIAASREPREKLEWRALRARGGFLADVASSYTTWIEGRT